MSLPIPLTTRNAPCVRYMLVRYAKGEVHEHESTLGVGAARSMTPAPEQRLTAAGREACARLRASNLLGTLASGVRQHSGAERVVSSLRCYVEAGAPLAAETARALGFESSAEWNRSMVRPLLDEADRAECILPVLIVGSAQFISDMLLRPTGGSCLWHVPLLSVSIYDLIAWQPPFVHCVGNTVTCPESVLWCNSA